MPTKREREYYAQGFNDGLNAARDMLRTEERRGIETYGLGPSAEVSVGVKRQKPKRKLSAWNKFVKANSKKPRFVLRSGKLNLKKMGVAFRKTPAGKKKKRR